jgi:hypothetical protein
METVMNTSSNKYPFLTKAQIAERLATDDHYVEVCLRVMANRHEAGGPQSGWMSSHVKLGGRLVEELDAAAETGDILSRESLTEARALVSRYTKQLAAQFRSDEISVNPELADEAACFFTPQPTSAG